MAVTSANELPAIRFGTYEVDLRAGELLRNGSRVRLQEQPFQVLLALVERPGEIVTRDEFVYENEGMEYIEIRWGLIREIRVHLDTARVAALDAQLSGPDQPQSARADLLTAS